MSKRDARSLGLRKPVDARVTALGSAETLEHLPGPLSSFMEA
ncbi:MAG TPA: hypothetical protein VH025_07200 [Solirubrobacteraceae bacterium]|nr:hypothetical protein [Solirubrobacteraceae bacterium]